MASYKVTHNGYRTWIDAMEIVQVGGKPKTLNSAFNVFPDMGRLVGDDHPRLAHVVSDLG